jgi:hypothetical protein
VAENNDHASDHLPIETVMDLTPRTTCQENPGYNFEKANWEIVELKIKEYLPHFSKYAAFTIEEPKPSPPTQ